MSNATDSAMLSAVFDAIEAEGDFVVGLTQDLVRIPSVNPKFQRDPTLNRESDVQERLQGVLEEEGFATERWEVFEGRPNLVGDKAGDEARSLILCGHIDVVPVGDSKHWTVEPFGGEVKDGRIYGRGAVDMKGGVASCIAAARAIRKAGVTLDGRLSIHSVVDEEAGGFGAMDAVARGKLAKAAIVAEPTWGDIMPAEGGLEWVRVTIFGKTAHAGWRFNSVWPQRQHPGRLEPGVNAIEIANRFLSALREFEAMRCRANHHPLMPPGLATINPGSIRGGAGLDADGLPAIMTNPAIIPDAVVIDLDYKFLPQEQKSEVRTEFERFVRAFADLDPWTRDHPPKVEWELGGLHFPPMDTPVDHAIVRSLQHHRTALGETVGLAAPTVRGFEAVTDAAHYAGAGVDAVIYGASGDGFHGDDECINIDSLMLSTKVIAAATLDWCGTK